MISTITLIHHKQTENVRKIDRLYASQLQTTSHYQRIATVVTDAFFHMFEMEIAQVGWDNPNKSPVFKRRETLIRVITAQYT